MRKFDPGDLLIFSSDSSEPRRFTSYGLANSWEPLVFGDALLVVEQADYVATWPEDWPELEKYVVVGPKGNFIRDFSGWALERYFKLAAR